MCVEGGTPIRGKTKKVVLPCAIVFVVGLLLASLLANAVEEARQAAIRVLRAKNLQALYVALCNYEEKEGGLPPAHTINSADQPIQSWRVLLLPYWEEKPLYSQIDLDKPWDSLANQRLLAPMPEMYRSPLAENANTTATNYFAILGPDAPCWGSRGLSPGKVAGSPDAVMLIELPGSKTPWMKPWDPTLDELLDILRPDSGNSANGGSAADFMYLTVGGDVRSADQSTDRESLRKLLLGERK